MDILKSRHQALHGRNLRHARRLRLLVAVRLDCRAGRSGSGGGLFRAGARGEGEAGHGGWCVKGAGL